jgi:hypothetical protein
MKPTADVRANEWCLSHEDSILRGRGTEGEQNLADLQGELIRDQDGDGARPCDQGNGDGVVIKEDQDFGDIEVAAGDPLFLHVC